MFALGEARGRRQMGLPRLWAKANEGIDWDRHYVYYTSCRHLTSRGLLPRRFAPLDLVLVYFAGRWEEPARYLVDTAANLGLTNEEASVHPFAAPRTPSEIVWLPTVGDLTDLILERSGGSRESILKEIQALRKSHTEVEAAIWLYQQQFRVAGAS